MYESALIGLLKNAGIDSSQKYYETLTEAGILAVHHFMCCTESSKSVDNFIKQMKFIGLGGREMKYHIVGKLLRSAN